MKESPSDQEIERAVFFSEHPYEADKMTIFLDMVFETDGFRFHEPPS